jgi:hypothetical protein
VIAETLVGYGHVVHSFVEGRPLRPHSQGEV